MGVASNSIFIGHNSRAQANGQTNQIVIGTDAVGSGSNTTTIGNLSTTSTVLRGTVSVTTLAASSAVTAPSFNGVGITRGLGSFEGNYGFGTAMTNISTSGGGENGKYNVGIGESSLSSNTTGSYNTALNRGLVSNTIGVWNTALGYNTMFFNTEGSRNTAVGMWSMPYMSTSNENTAVGTDSGKLDSSGTALTSAAQSVFIGYNSRAKNTSQTNQIVIGSSAVGNGSNTATIGNSSTDALYLGGKAGEGIVLTAPNGTKYRVTVSNAGALTATAI
jgi:hypothetical protein